MFLQPVGDYVVYPAPQIVMQRERVHMSRHCGCLLRRRLIVEARVALAPEIRPLLHVPCRGCEAIVYRSGNSGARDQMGRFREKKRAAAAT